MNQIAKFIFQRLRKDERGIAIVEFAFAGPLFLLLLMGVFDIGYAMYIKSALQGAVNEAGRGATLENTAAATLDARVATVLGSLNKSGTVEYTRTFYERYTDVTLPEDMQDNNNNGQRDPGECFVDRNGNSIWDSDVGFAGRGGAQDVVIYRAEFTYTRIFPLWRMLNQSPTQVLVGETVLRNQPFSAQAVRSRLTICT